MKTKKTSIIIEYTVKKEIANGVFEDELHSKKVIAQKEQISQKRLDLALRDGFVINARFSLRSHLIEGDPKYIVYDGARFRVRTIQENVSNHFAILEAGELV